jgi:hypothetical protein
MYVDPEVPAVLLPAVDVPVDVDPGRDVVPDADVSVCALVSMNRPLALEPVVPLVDPVVPVEPLI